MRDTKLSGNKDDHIDNKQDVDPRHRSKIENKRMLVLVEDLHYLLLA